MVSWFILVVIQGLFGGTPKHLDQKAFAGLQVLYIIDFVHFYLIKNVQYSHLIWIFWLYHKVYKSKPSLLIKMVKSSRTSK